MKKMVIITSTMAILMSGCMNQALQVVNSGGAGQLASGAVSGGNGKCIPRMGGGSASMMDMATKFILNPLIEEAIQDATGIDDLKMPAKIMDTCEADKRLTYIKVITDNYTKSMTDINDDLLASLKQTKKIQDMQVQIDNRNKNREEADLEGAIKDNEAILEIMKDATIQDKAKYSAALGKIVIASPVRIGELIGWDKEIVEFSKDNIVWAIQNVESVKDIIFQIGVVADIVPTVYALKDSPLYEGRVDKDIAEKAAKELIKSDKEVADDAEFED